MSVHISACWPFPWTDPCTDLDISSSFDGLDCPNLCTYGLHFIGQSDILGGGSNLSDKGLNLSGSWQQGHSATYNTPSRFYPPLGGNYNSRRSERRFHRTDLANDTCLWEPKLLLRVGNRAAGACVASSPDSDLEAFSHNPAHGSFAPLAFQPSAMTNCANQRFLSY
ncbi:unnamed protein product [Brassica rapa subsp. trilocularis]